MCSKIANKLIDESSPYLLQHAYNPVEWYPWGEEALNKAITEDKPIIVSIGYAACHWCHVMERESFEDEQLAALMNKNYVCIKIDREERPEIDQIYMDAVQAMGMQGGWPLNVFLTPDQKPFYGGTYFPPYKWGQVLQQIALAFRSKRQEIEKSSDQLTNALSQSTLEKFGLVGKEDQYEAAQLENMFTNLSNRFDIIKGGMDKAPKFPMPSIYEFLFRYYAISGDQKVLNQIELTLDQMAMGGIYDQVGGGFARYSTDAFWFAPHFEKMLYDNAQLLSLYSMAFTNSKKELYKEVVYETVDFLKREMDNKVGGFYAALDADSEGVEGKFYTWKYDELVKILKDEIQLFADYYQVKKEGNWEEEVNILNTKDSIEAFCKNHELNVDGFKLTLNNWKKLLLAERSKRIRPGLDNKILTSWNALLLKGLLDAAAAFNDKGFLEMAISNANFIDETLYNNQVLWHTYQNGKVKVRGFLEDYALVINAYITLYQICFDEAWIDKAASLLDYTINNFYDEEEGLFFFTDKASEKLISRKKEVFDNVIPASNSVMARNLHLLGLILDKKKYSDKADRMLLKINKLLKSEVEYLSNWGCLLTDKIDETIEIAIIGEDYKKFAFELHQQFIPNKLIFATANESDLPLLKNRNAIDGKTTIYVCRNKTCKLPVHSVEEALQIIDETRKA